MKNALDIEALRGMLGAFAEEVRLGSCSSDDLQELTGALSQILNEIESIQASSEEPAANPIDRRESLDTEIQERRRAENVNQALFNVSKAVHKAPSLKKLYAFIHQALGDVIDLTNFFIGIVNKEENSILLPYYIDQFDIDLKQIPNYTESNALAGVIIRTRQPVFMTEEMLREWAAQKSFFGTPPRIWIGVPLMIDNEVIGVMATQSYDDPNHFDHKDLDVLTAVSEQVAMAIQRKRAEEDLKDSEERFRRLHEASFGGIGIHDQGFILDANMGLAELSGYEHGELIGMDGLQLIAPDYREFVMGKISSGYEKPYDAEGLRKDGTVFPLEIRGKTIPYRGRMVWVTEFRDILDRKRTEEKLRQSEEKYRTILESMEDAYFEVDLAGNFTFLNDATCKHLGYSRNELLDMDNRAVMDSETARSIFSAFSEAYRTGQPTKVIDLRIIRKDGSTGNTEMVVSLIKGEQDLVVGFRGVARDVTDRKRAEREHRRLEAQLQQSQRLESLGKLAGGVAHDFNNLLMGIQGRTSLMMFDMERSDPKFGQLVGIEELIDSAAGLTRQLLGLARGGKYESKPLNLNTLISQSLEMFGRTKKELSILSELDPRIWTVVADKTQLDQVLLNLFVNAWQAMPSGGKLRVRSENVTLDTDAAKPFQLPGGAYVKISVTDTGTGIDENIQERIFDPFFTTKDKSSGIGLGLSSVYGIVKNHDGFIKVDSRKGAGATISFFLPASLEVHHEDKRETGGMVKGTGTVLLVDDEDIILDVGKDVIQHIGYSVLTAESGSRALDIFRRENGKIDLVIIDMIMPEMNGGELYDRIKKIQPDIPALLSSGYSLDGQAVEIMDRGCNGFIQKPFTINQLSRKIQEVLSNSRE